MVAIYAQVNLKSRAKKATSDFSNVGAKVKRIFEVRMDLKTTIPNNPEQSLMT